MKSPCTVTETQSRINHLRPLFACAGAAVALCVIVRAEMAPSYLPPAEEVLQLEKVKVVGQSASNTYAIQRSLAATKTDTALMDVPQAITVVTRELIDDQAM